MNLPHITHGFIDAAEVRVFYRETGPDTGIRGQYETGAGRLERIAPDGWILDQHFLESPKHQRAQLSLLQDYPGNVERYPEWQRWLREHRPPTLIVWGRGDPFFTEAGARAYLGDLPEAELHLFETGTSRWRNACQRSRRSLVSSWSSGVAEMDPGDQAWLTHGRVRKVVTSTMSRIRIHPLIGSP